MKSNRLSLLLLSLLVAGSFTGCGSSDTGKPAKGKKATSIGAAAVYRSDANVYGQAEMKASEFAFGDLNKEADKERFEAFTTATGLTEKDILEAVICGSVTNLNMADLGALTDVEALPVNFAFTLAKAVSFAQFKAGMEALQDDPDGQYTEEAVNGTTILKMVPSDDTKPTTFGTMARDGKTAFIAFNQNELERTLAIEQSGIAEQVSAPLHAAFTNLASSAHMRVAILLPEIVRTSIRTKINEAKEDAGPLGGMLFGVFEPFVQMQSIGVASHFSTNLVLDVVGDMQDPENAAKAKAGMIVVTGMLQGMLMGGPDAPSINLGEAMKSEARGKFLNLTINMPKDVAAAVAP
ncbi:MAG: hypothetical protein ACI97B_003287 [Verrucomicrobiales bacterium]|jgi:hypothetical protein